jgi:hypothetical protein
MGAWWEVLSFYILPNARDVVIARKQKDLKHCPCFATAHFVFDFSSKLF